MLKVGDDFDLDSVTKEFSPPTQIETLFQTHRTPSPETSYVFHFDSIVIDVEHGAIRTIEFTSLRLSTHRSVRIGDSADEVRSAYGKPSKEDWLGCPSGLSYFGKNSTLGLTFCISEGRVVRIFVGWGGT